MTFSQASHSLIQDIMNYVVAEGNIWISSSSDLAPGTDLRAFITVVHSLELSHQNPDSSSNFEGKTSVKAELLIPAVPAFLDSKGVTHPQKSEYTIQAIITVDKNLEDILSDIAKKDDVKLCF